MPSFVTPYRNRTRTSSSGSAGFSGGSGSSNHKGGRERGRKKRWSPFQRTRSRSPSYDGRMIESISANQYPMEVRVKNFSYSIPIESGNHQDNNHPNSLVKENGSAQGSGLNVDTGDDMIQEVPASPAPTIRTVYNASFIYPAFKYCQRVWRGERPWRKLLEATYSPRNQGQEPVQPPDPAPPRMVVLDNINLFFEPGKSYLVLGPPGSGKTTLLKAISGRLHHPVIARKRNFQGSISYNGRTLEEKDEFYIENACAYIEQLDTHAPRLTVEETFDFAHKCKAGEKVFREQDVWEIIDDSDEIVRAEKDKIELEVILSALGLKDVKNTFVGDANIRGISGGQRRRVTVGEMLTSRASVLCGDEISNGLDTRSTYNMIRILLHFGKYSRLTRVFSLLQPNPETVRLFDEVIVLAEGQVIYAGPMNVAEEYFAEIGFVCPRFIDIADFLVMISTEHGRSLYDPYSSIKAINRDPPTVSELADIFRHSHLGRQMEDRLNGPHQYLWKLCDNVSKHGSSHVSMVSLSNLVKFRYSNSFLQSARLILARFITLWLRDRRVIIAGAAKNVLMGVSVGGAFLSSDNAISIMGALFQACLFIMLGAMQSASAMIADREIFFKHTDSNFYSAGPFVLGRALSQIPQTTADTITFATIMYYLIGLANRTDFGNYLTYVSLLLAFAILMNQQLSVFASFASPGTLNAYCACTILMLILYGGFIVAPSTIPGYFSWLYWWNPFAWIYRALVINEFRCGRWRHPNTVLRNIGFVNRFDQPYGSEWIGFAFAYAISYAVLCGILTALGLTYIRSEGSAAMPSDSKQSTTDCGDIDHEPIEIPFKPVTITFQNLCYDVKASTGKERLRLLDHIDGVFHAGRMCALMGSSGAGKTTLMDVIALRKRSGTITGDIRLNGWPQESVSFRRSSGYVEQFDVQSPELTVRETILFSARLRLDPNLGLSQADVKRLVEKIIDTVELTCKRNSVVGLDKDDGLSFAEKKRLSIAVELAASPSVLFLDEPTTGLDSRSALMIVKTLRKIADGGRTICATIHQPSSAVFSLFDDLLLLQAGQVAYHGDLGEDRNCAHLVTYFESRGAPPIENHENPANWIFHVMDACPKGSLAEFYLQSSEYSDLINELEEIQRDPDIRSKVVVTDKFAASSWERRLRINSRLRSIYWRSPTYNYARLLVSLMIAAVLGSAFYNFHSPPYYTESGMRARVSVVFLSFIITGIMAMISVIPVMTKIRDMYYRHRDAHMYDSYSMGLALGVAEQPFIVISTAIFSTVFLATAGLVPRDDTNVTGFIRGVAFWGYFTFNFAIYSYMGQLFVCLVKSTATAIILASVFIGLNNFFSGLIIRPQFLVGTFYEIPYLITPGHYVYDGLMYSLYNENTDIVIADPFSEFEDYLIDQDRCIRGHCNGTASEYINNFFGGEFGLRGAFLGCLVLGCILTLSRIFTWVALKYIRFA